MKKTLLLLVIFVFTSFTFFAQSITGKVLDADTKNPVPFALISTLNKKSGTVADIDGKFNLTVSDTVTMLLVSVLGYESKKVAISASNQSLVVYLKARQFTLKTAVISAGENPAEWVIRKTYENRKRNDSEQLDFYDCRVYNKLIIGGEADTSRPKSDETKKSAISADSLFKKQHLFFIETANRRIRSGNRVWESVEGSNSSGLKGSALAVLLPQIQPFGFYEAKFGIDQVLYENPIYVQNRSIYKYELTDTVYTSNDTLFVVTFEPRNSNRTDVLKGVVYVSKRDFAIENVIAQPTAGPQQTIKIQQQFQKIGSQWFPYLIKTDFNNPISKDSSITLNFRIRTTVTQVSFNDTIKKKPAGLVGLLVDPQADNFSEDQWKAYRIDTLTDKEKRTIQMVDSLVKASRFTWIARAMDALATGEIPYKFININLNRVIAFNPIEGFRLGIGGRTNQKVSQFFELGGYAGYGFKDRRWKNNAHIKLYLVTTYDFTFKIRYQNELFESGMTRFTGNPRLPSAELLRLLYVQRMDYLQETEVSAEWRIRTVLKTEAGYRQSQYESAFDYQFADFENQRSYRYSELFASFKFKPGEKFLRKGNYLISLGSKSSLPVIQVQVSQGIKTPDWGNWEYTRVDVEIQGSKRWKQLGTTNYALVSGYVNASVPMNRLFAPRANRELGNDFLVAGTNTFETMQPNEFLSDQYAAVFFRHHFGRLVKIKDFTPSWGIVHNAAVGRLSNPLNHSGVANSSFDKGYTEGGVYLSGLVRSTFSSLGLGFFYRYGAYAHSDQKQNAVLKLYFNTAF